MPPLTHPAAHAAVDATAHPFDARAGALLASLRAGGQYKVLQTLDSPMDASVRLRRPDGSTFDALCFCSNNYLGLANNPEVIEAGVKALRDFGAGTASVRFICGTFSPHHHLEALIAKLMGTEASYSFVSAWTANEAVFPTLCEPGDTIISDELNHACIIDSIRLTTIIKKGVNKAVYKHNDLDSLRQQLQAVDERTRASGAPADAPRPVTWVVTDGVFSMEGDIADLPAIRRLCDQHNALLVVDDSHGTGVMGKHARGTHEHWNMIDPLGHTPSTNNASTQNNTSNTNAGRVDLFTGTLGKALGGGAGGYVAGSKRAVDLLVQRARPTLFSNALPVTVAASSAKAIEILLNDATTGGTLVAKLHDNVRYAREQIRRAGFNVLESPTAICPIIVHDTAKAIAMSARLLELGVYVIGFGYPVVPEGHARLRVQISAAHSRQHIDALVDALKKL
jgi:glycine C-acetyltransferase